jgi:hypothetical protein
VIRNRKWAIVTGVLLLLLGLGRGFGGLILLTRGTADMPRSDVSSAAAEGMAFGLLAVGLLAIIGAVGVLRSSTAGLWIAVLALVTFVAGGIVNGFLLFGQPRPAGIIGNVALASLIAACIWLSARSPSAKRAAM